MSVRNTGLVATAVAYDSKRDLIYVLGSNPKQVSVVNPATGKVASIIALGKGGGYLAISGDSSKLYVGEYTQIQRIDLATSKVDETFFVDPALATNSAVPINSATIRVAPGKPDTVAVSVINSKGSSLPRYIISIFDKGVRRTNSVALSAGVPTVRDIQFASDGISVLAVEDTSFLEYCPVAATGITFGKQFASGLLSMAYPTVSAEGRGKFFYNRSAYDEKSLKVVGTFGSSTESWQIAPEATIDRVLAVTCKAVGASPTLVLADSAKYSVLKSLPLLGLPAIDGAGVSKLTLAGTRCAFLLGNTKDQSTTLAFLDNVPL